MAFRLALRLNSPSINLSAGRRSPYSVREPELVAQIEFTEWTPDGHLRHSKFVGLREDKEARDVVREIEG
jgi:ATP-dependent DNA ligase